MGTARKALRVSCVLILCMVAHATLPGQEPSQEQEPDYMPPAESHQMAEAAEFVEPLPGRNGRWDTVKSLAMPINPSSK